MSLTSLTEEEYLNQHLYYSESQHGFVQVSSMAPPYAMNAFQKLRREFGEVFDTSTLWLEFMRYLRPDPDEVLQRLKREGHVTVWTTSDYQLRARARRVMYRVGKKLGVRVSTRYKNGFVTGEVVKGPLTIRVKGEEVE